ncbi:AfsR/SARP family transcriptional regulator [Allorhizocola rhizosphaerae]|uniref:AfsR/SARP family transcriptional regulator n=1 Tax=Allorhizocola rhizosphaerae TaxID=1872709 RepID=UPI001B8D7374|nr:AfsR/SARP family transcriptional regulator [Allorhizocola rhizosphaerae]
MIGKALHIDVLGPLHVTLAGWPTVVDGTKPRALLTILALHQGRMVPASALTALLWGDDPPRTARKALQTHVSTLRRVLGDGVVVTMGEGWALRAGSTDVARFCRAAELGREHACAGDPAAAVSCFDEALALWRGDPELCRTDRSRSEAARWIEQHQTLVEDRLEALLHSGHAGEVIGELEAAVGAAPLRERRWALLCHALYLACRQAEALAAYQRARTTLARELGVEPGPELRRMQAAILAHDPMLDTVQIRHHPEDGATLALIAKLRQDILRLEQILTTQGVVHR